MALPMKTFGRSAFGNILNHFLFNNVSLTPRVVPQVQFIREKRLFNAHPHRTDRVDKTASLNRAELTDRNARFLQDAFTDIYKDKLRAVGSPLKDGPWKRFPWTPQTLRTGVLAIKIGVVPQWTKTGEKFYTTMLQVIDNHVIRYIPPEHYNDNALYQDRKWWRPNKYGAVIVGALSCQPFHLTKQYCGLFTESGLPPKRKLTNFLVTPDAAVQPGTPLYATHFRVGDYVDVQAKTIGHGFQGVVKRWGFKGGPASHGTTKWHRRPGNIAGGRGKGKVWKGKKMPGRMGFKFRVLRGLKIWRIDTKHNILYVHGPCTPGPTHCYTRVMDTCLPKRRQLMAQRQPGLPMPTFYPDDVSEPLPEEIFDKDLFQFTEPSVTYAPDPKEKSKAKAKAK